MLLLEFSFIGIDEVIVEWAGGLAMISEKYQDDMYHERNCCRFRRKRSFPKDEDRSRTMLVHELKAMHFFNSGEKYAPGIRR